MSSFLSAKNEFDTKNGKTKMLSNSLVTVDGKILKDISLSDKKGGKNEEYYKWQFIYALINSGLYSKDYIGAEIYFPKGNKNSAPIKIDACIFDDKEWIEHYKKWRDKKDDDAVDWLRQHLLAIVEFKKSDGKDIKKVFTSQIRAELKESDRDYCLGYYYDTERLYIFQKKKDAILRYDEQRNQKGDKSGITQLSLDLTDSYKLIPSFEGLKKRIDTSSEIDRSTRTVDDLDPITGASSSQISHAISDILKTLDRVGLRNSRGYEILIEMMALKIFDEKRSDEFKNTQSTKKYLEFYQTNPEKVALSFFITDQERQFFKLSDENVQSFVQRIKTLYTAAQEKYNIILEPIDNATIVWKDESHIRAIASVVENLQDYSFINSADSDLYQLVFYKFANEFSKTDKAQFITPLKIIDFLVKAVNPKKSESIIDPTVGIADFLSVSFVNAQGELDDKNIYGVDNDSQMIKLAQLNMLLNGDGNAILKYQPDKGSLLYKFDTRKELVALDYKLHQKGNWDNWVDATKLMKFDIVLTNPPFGENRKFEPKTETDKALANLYELWEDARSGSWIDPGLLFLENAYRILKTNGRMGFVVSNSIASIDRWEVARRWLLEKMRIVGLFDLPPNVFAETGVNTTLIVAYKPSDKELEKLKKSEYEIFVKDIQKIGYEVRTTKRVKYFKPIYKVDENTFDPILTEEGEQMLDEDFTKTLTDFKKWILSQEETLKKLFI
ncbi:MAG: N-6 DNA methylase [Patescibacteria group bacterium]|nr:N-6 DNA methylase [Patescibacteria group bacterium]